MSHGTIPEELRMKYGITDNLVRISVGIEKIDDLIEDLIMQFSSKRDFIVKNIPILIFLLHQYLF